MLEWDRYADDYFAVHDRDEMAVSTPVPLKSVPEVKRPVADDLGSAFWT